MTPGERIVRRLLGQPVDRLPFGVGLGWSPWGETLGRWRTESGDATLDPARLFSYDASFALPCCHLGAFPAFPETMVDGDAEHVVVRDWRGILTRRRRDGTSMPEFLEHPVRSPRDWATYRDQRLGDAEGRVAEDWPAFRRRLAASGEAVQVGVFPFGMFGTARDLIGAERLLYWLHDEPDTVAEIMQHCTDLWLACWERVAQAVRIDHIHIWEDCCGKAGPLLSPRMAERFMMPCYDRIAAFAHRHGVRLLSVDSDGDCRAFAAVIVRHGVNVLFPFETQSGCLVEDYAQAHPTLGLWGGLDKRALAGDDAALEAELARAQRLAALPRWVPMWDHLIPPDVPWERFRSATLDLRALCHRPR